MNNRHRFDWHLERANGDASVQKRIIGNGLRADIDADAREWQQNLDRFLPTNTGLDALPAGSWLLKFTFTLAQPFSSKTEGEFHPYQEQQHHSWFELQNPTILDHLTGLPLVTPTTWKGHLRFAACMASIPEPMINRLFGETLGEKGGRAGRLHFFPTFFSGGVEREVVTPLQRTTRSPTRGPIDIEVVPKGSVGTFCLLYIPYPRGRDWAQEQISEDLETAAAVLKVMLLEYGFSAKKTAGWGVIEDVVTDGNLWARGQMWPPLTKGSVRVEAPSFQEPRSEYSALMEETGEPIPGLRKPDGAWLSNTEFNALLEKPASLNGYRRFRSWYDTHGEVWRRKLSGSTDPMRSSVQPYQLSSVTALYDLTVRLAKALRQEDAHG